MKTTMACQLYLAAGLCSGIIQTSLGGQSALVTTYQPLDALGKADIQIVSVTCHHWYANSASSEVELIGIRNVPPTDRPEHAKEDLNLASVCGVNFSTSDLGVDKAPFQIWMDVTQFETPKSFAHHQKEDIIRACLECLRRCTQGRLSKTPVTLKCRDSERGWLMKIITEFNSSDRSRVFFKSKE